MAKHSAHRSRLQAASRFGLESMESRTLLSGAWGHDGHFAPPAGLRSWQKDGDRHAVYHRHERANERRDDRGEDYSFQGRDDDGASSPLSPRRETAGFDGRYSPFVPPAVVILPPWVRVIEPATPPAPATPQSAGSQSAVETKPVVAEAPRAAEVEPVVASIHSATTAKPSPSVATTPSIHPAVASVSTSAAMMGWMKSGALYAADVAGLTPSMVVENAAPVAKVAVEQIAAAEQAVLSAAVTVISVPAREFHIARLGSPLALMQDAIGSFIEQSVWPTSDQTVSGPRRAWYITLTVLTLDAALLTYYFHYRRDNPKSVFATVRRRPLMAAMARRDD